MPKITDGTYYAVQKLLAGPPDINQRTVYCWPSDKKILVMNVDNRPWTDEDQQILDLIVNTLNASKND